MEFWGAEVKPGQTLKVQPGDDKVLHLSQASLGEVKKDKNESIFLYVKVDGQKLVVGTLSADKCTHISYDLVFEKDFEISHSGKSGSIYFCGYKSVLSDEPEDFSDSEFDSDEDNLLEVMGNGKPEPKEELAKPKANNASKPDSSAAKKVKIEEPKKDKTPKEDEDEDDDDEDDEDDSEDVSDDEEMLDGEDDSDDEDDSSDEEDETPKKVQQGKKRPAESVAKPAPASDKKAKLVTPQKKGTDGKKGAVHVSTPHPSKGGKTPVTDDKSKPQTPKSAGQIQCKSCTKTFTSEKGLESHSKAKHSAGGK